MYCDQNGFYINYCIPCIQMCQIPGPTGATGVTGPAGSAGPDTYNLYVKEGALPGGDGSQEATYDPVSALEASNSSASVSDQR